MNVGSNRKIKTQSLRSMKAEQFHVPMVGRATLEIRNYEWTKLFSRINAIGFTQASTYLLGGTGCVLNECAEASASQAQHGSGKLTCAVAGLSQRVSRC